MYIVKHKIHVVSNYFQGKYLSATLFTLYYLSVLLNSYEWSKTLICFTEKVGEREKAGWGVGG